MPTQEEVDAALDLYHKRFAAASGLFSPELLPSNLSEKGQEAAAHIRLRILRGPHNLESDLEDLAQLYGDRAVATNSESLHSIARRCLVAVEFLRGDLGV